MPDLCCPRCGSPLQRPDTTTYHCPRCAHDYPVLLGIPDLRTGSDPYLTNEQDRAKAEWLAAHAADTDLHGLVDLYYSENEAVPEAQRRLFTRGLLGAPARAAGALDEWEPDTPAGASLLDVGCGTGPLLVAAAARGLRPVGVDAGLRWLVIARKRAQEAGVEVDLVCASAEALPFPGATFDRVALDAALEHVADADTALRECARTLRGDGRLFLATPNRFSIGPDPHVGLWAGGMLPDRLIAWYVRRKGGVPPRRHLFSAPALRRTLRRAGFETDRIFAPGVPAGQRALFEGPLRRAVDAYDRVRTWPGARNVLLAIGPVLSAVASRHDAAGRAAASPQHGVVAPDQPEHQPEQHEHTDR